MIRRLTLGITSFLASFGFALPALAALQGGATGPTVGTGFGTIGESINTIFTFVITIAGVIFVVLFLVGGIQYLTAAGNEEQTGKAKRLLVDAIVGVIIVLLAWAAGNFILTRLGLNLTV